jgi:hypothetical protein
MLYLVNNLDTCEIGNEGAKHLIKTKWKLLKHLYMSK